VLLLLPTVLGVRAVVVLLRNGVESAGVCTGAEIGLSALVVGVLIVGVGVVVVYAVGGVVYVAGS
jgi:hypothetical protein